jgi:superfamily I DNA/RNA helicase
VAANSKVKVKLVRSPAKSELLAPEQLSAEQNKVINHRSSPLLVLGSAGSGKTTTLVNAVASRVAQGLDANNILAITYG